jgi:site-specific recombinase XerD
MFSSHDETVLTRFEEALNQMALSPSTVVNYLADLRTFLQWGKAQITPDFSLEQARQDHLRLYRHHLIDRLNRASSTVNRHLMALRKFFAFAKEAGLVSLDPTLGLPLVQDSNAHAVRPLSEEEIEKLMESARNGVRAGLVRRDVAILQLLIHTGLRVNEVIELKKEDLVFDDPGVHLKVCPNGDEAQTRQLPVPGQVCKILTDYLTVRPQTSTGYLFLSQDGRPISVRTVQRIINDCARAAGLQGVSAQAMRRTFALQLLAKTGDLALVSRRLGHQNKSITEQYLSSLSDQ